MKFVRSRMDELSAAPSDMIADSVDDRNLSKEVEENLKEAIEHIHLLAPLPLLEASEVLVWEKEGKDNTVDVKIGTDGVADITMPDEDVLRIVYIDVKGCRRVSQLNIEDSPEGRMQLNKWARGTYDDPVAVTMQDTAEHHPHIKIYTVPADAGSVNVGVYSVPEDDGSGYDISAKLELPVLNYLVAMVLRNYGMQSFQTFEQIAYNYLK